MHTKAPGDILGQDARRFRLGAALMGIALGGALAWPALADTGLLTADTYLVPDRKLAFSGAAYSRRRGNPRPTHPRRCAYRLLMQNAAAK
jgi:hypothetical protein